MNIITKKYYQKSEGELFPSWKDVEELTQKIIYKIHEDGFMPDVIICIARSGLIPGAMISYALENKELYVIKVDFSQTQKKGKDQDIRRRPKLSQELSKDVEGMKVLVVDEVVVSGETLKTVQSYLEMKNAIEVRYCVLYKQPWSEFEPDYFGMETKCWPVLPWKDLK
jgi:uncharacterized protein